MALGLEKNESFAEIFEKSSSLLSNHSIFIVEEEELDQFLKWLKLEMTIPEH